MEEAGFVERRLGEFGWSLVREGAGNPLGVVFVHGWNGHFRDTWTFRPSWRERRRGLQETLFLPALLGRESELRADLFSFGHSAGPFSAATVDTVALSLATFLRAYLGERAIVLVTHSLGGLVTRQAIVKLLQAEDPLAQRVLGLLMLGTPNSGVEISRSLGEVTAALGTLLPTWWRLALRAVLGPLVRRGATAQLEVFSAFLQELNRDWLTHVVNGGQPTLPLDRRSLLLCRSVLGERDRVVPAASAASMSSWAECGAVNEDHCGLAKASSVDAPVYRSVRDFVHDCSTHREQAPILTAAELLAVRCRERMVSEAGWILEERERVILRPLSSGEPAPRRSGGRGVFRCTIQVIRRLPSAPEVVRIAACAEGCAPSFEDLAYIFGIGKGLATDDQYAKLFSDLPLDGTETGLEGLFSPGRVRLEVDGRILDFRGVAASPRREPGCLIWELRPVEPVPPHPSEIRLTLEMTGLVSLPQGWYTYFAGRPVVGRLAVSLEAPFPVRPLSRWWWSRQSPPTVTRLPNQNYLSQLECDGPVPREARIHWIFPRETDDGHEEEGTR